MLRIIPIALVLLFASCSKPSGDSTVNDSTATNEEDVGGREQHLPPQYANSIKLSAAELEQVKMKVFMWLHTYQTYEYHPGFVVVKEEFNANEAGFSYYLIRENMKTGRFGDKDFPYDAGELVALDESPPEPVDSAADMEEYYDEGEATDPNWYNEGYDIPERDTIEGSVKWAFHSSENPEHRLINVSFTGQLYFDNFQYVKYGETIVVKKEIYIPDMTIDLSTPFIFEPDQLYLKAKIASLTEQDLAGMSKEEVAYLRNEIFARHGHTFKTDKMKNYFNPKEWYHSLGNDASKLLNNFEKQNVEYLKSKEG